MTKAGQGSYLLNLEALCKKNGFPNRGQLEREARAEKRKLQEVSLGIRLGVLTGTDTIYRIQIGQSIWALRLSEHGPQLQLQERPYTKNPDQRDTSDLGIFQSINRLKSSDEFSSGCWAVTRYGHQPVHVLDFMSDEEVNSLSKHFGIPFWKDDCSVNQMHISEKSFIKSEAFLALRTALRSGAYALPDLGKWSYGLTPAWAHCVGFSENDLNVIPKFVESYFHIVRRRSILLLKFHHDLSEKWKRIPFLGHDEALEPSLIAEIIELADSVDRHGST